MSQTHELKTLALYFDAVERGEKTFEVRHRRWVLHLGAWSTPMKPEWCPSEIWTRAEEIQANTKYDEEVHSHAPVEELWEAGLHDCEMYARALLDAHQRGRREGMEEAAEVVRQQVPTIPVDGPTDPIQEAEYFALGHALIAIRDKMENQP